MADEKLVAATIYLKCGNKFNVVLPEGAIFIPEHLPMQVFILSPIEAT